MFHCTDPMNQSSDKPATRPSPLFVAVGQQGQLIISADGREWTHQQFGKEGEVYRAVAFGNGRCAVIGSYGGDNIFASSADCITWETGKKDAHYSTYLRAVGFGKDAFLALGGDPGAVGDSKPFIMTSPDGVKWTEPFHVAGKNILRRFAFGNGLYVAVGDRGRRAVSSDGREWKDAPDVKAIDTLVDVTFGKGIFVGVGLNGLRMSSEDGLKWSERLVGEEGEHCNSVLFTGEQFVAIGLGATYLSPDGRTWTRKENKDAPLTAAYGDGVYVGSNWKGRILRSTDAVEWKQVFKSEHHIEALCYGSAA